MRKRRDVSANMTVTAQIPGPAWYRLRFLGMLIVGAGVVFVSLTLVGYFAQSPNALAIPYLDAGFLVVGSAMVAGSVWMHRAHPDWK